MANKILESLTIGGWVSRATSTNSTIRVWVNKLIDLGGVIRRLLNALKPLAFRLEGGCA